MNNALSKYVNFLLFFIMNIMLLVVAIIEHNISTTYRIGLIIYSIVSSIWLGFFSSLKRVSIFVYAIICTFMMTLTCIAIGDVTNDSGIYLLVLSIPVVGCVFYLQPKLFKYVLSIILAQLLLCCFIRFNNMDNLPRTLELVLYAVIISGCSLVLDLFVRMIQYQDKKSTEQEKSVDDMLKVVYAKCLDAQNATKSKSAFLSNMSHEIRTPINAILGMNEMILRETREEAIRRYAINIENSGNTLLALINDILDFSKIESGKMEIVPVDYQLSSVLNDLINIFRNTIREKNLQLYLEIEPDIPNTLQGDDVRLKQIITNIMSNAVKYTDKGDITLKVYYEYTDVNEIGLHIVIKDTGQGMTKESLERLYNSFERFDEKKNRQIQGTGLGMAITKRIVDQMNGEIFVDSVYGVGTVFHIVVPQTVVDHSPMGPFKQNYEKSKTEHSDYKNNFTAPDANILVVDDNIMNLEVVKGLIKPLGSKVDCATSGRECIAMMQKKRYDIVFLDHMMPGMDGVETLKIIKENKLDRDTPVIALTANAIAGARDMYLNYGFSDYLTKPIAGRKLEASIAQWLNHKK